MKQSEIRKQRKEFERQIKELEKQIKSLRFQRKQLEDECTHPNINYYTDMIGDRCSECPDCGRMT